MKSKTIINTNFTLKLLLYITIIQIIILPIITLKSYAGNDETIYIDTSLGKIIMINSLSSVQKGEIFPIEIYVEGEDIYLLETYVKYDRNLFEDVKLEDIVINVDNWGLNLSEIDYDEEIGFNIVISSNELKGISGRTKICTINLKAKDTVNNTKVSLSYPVITKVSGEHTYEETLEKNLEIEPNLPVTEVIPIKSTLKVNPNGGIWQGSEEVQNFEGNCNETKEIPEAIGSSNGYTVTFDANEGNVQNSSVKSSQVFTNWELINGGTLEGTIYTYKIADGELKAIYEPQKITLETPEREGYEFKGWYTPKTEENESVKVGNAGEEYSPTSDITLHAEWEKIGDEPTPPEEKLTLSSEKYKIGNNDINNYEEGDKYISEVEKDTSKETFIENLKTNGEIRVLKADRTELEENGLIETGMILEVTKGDEKRELTIQLKEPESKVLKLSSGKYKIGNNDIDNYEKEDIYLDKIEPDTTVAKLKENCEYYETLKVITLDEEGKERILKDDEFVGTGMTIRIEAKGYEDKIELKAVVMDDLDGDGQVTPTDLSTMKHVLQEEVKLEGAFFLAADLDDSKEITPTDLSTINNVILEVIKLTFTKNVNQQ